MKIGLFLFPIWSVKLPPLGVAYVASALREQGHFVVVRDYNLEIYKKWNAATWEKISVLIFIVLAAITLMGAELPQGELGGLVSGGIIPVLNILVALKVALGSWAVILLFIRYRGLL